ncbi:MAG: RNA methyltransferase [Ruminococcus sp.]|nr:RNA methyltransferase [Ruminococcus sp.]
MFLLPNPNQPIEITDFELPALIPYRTTSEVQLMHYYEPEQGLFIAESPKVIRRALDAGYQPESFLIDKKFVTGQASDIIERCPDVPVYTAAASVLSELTGFKLTLGAMCAMRRRPSAKPEEVLQGASRVAVLEDIMNQTNVGAIFRSAAALGFDAVLLTPACSDPLYRRSVRVSMGTVFQIPWAYLECSPPDYVDFLREKGFAAAAMALRHDTVSVDDPKLAEEERLAVILGTEGEGLREETISACDYTIKIPMYHGVDSLNVAAASAVAFFSLSKKHNA